MSQSPIHWWTAFELAAELRAGRLSSREATDHCLARIERLDPELHAFVNVLPEAARADAARADAERAGGEDRGPLHGIPIAVKDLCAVRGVATAAGTRVLRDRIAREDACVVARLREAGAVLLGTVAMTEGAFVAHHPDVEGPRNPWNPERWSGVSSSGSGVAVAAGLCFGALGTDTGGSIRFPSAVNGVTGIKPSYGRVPRHGVFPLSESLDHVGPLARCTRDAVHLLSAIAGFDPRDPTALRAPLADCEAALSAGARGLRVGIDPRYARDGLDAAIVEPMLAAAEAVLRDAGADVKEVVLPGWDQALGAWVPICTAEAALAHAGLFPERRDDYGPELRELLERGRSMTAVELARAQQVRRRFRADVDDLFEEVDLLLCPTLGVPAPPRVPDWNDPSVAVALVRFTSPFDLTGSPTLSLPCGFDTAGMPTSLQLVARREGEAMLAAAGGAWERATDWWRRHPALE